MPLLVRSSSTIESSGDIDMGEMTFVRVRAVSAYFSAHSRAARRACEFILRAVRAASTDQEARKDDKPLILPIEAWCLDWTRSFPYPFHVITAGTEATLLPAGNCDNLSTKGGRCRRRAGGDGVAGAKIGGRISTSLRSDQPDLFLLYLPPRSSRCRRLHQKPILSRGRLAANRFSNNTPLAVRNRRAWLAR